MKPVERHEHDAHVWQEPQWFMARWFCVGHGAEVDHEPALGYLHCRSYGGRCPHDGFVCSTCVVQLEGHEVAP